MEKEKISADTMEKIQVSWKLRYLYFCILGHQKFTVRVLHYFETFATYGLAVAP